MEGAVHRFIRLLRLHGVRIGVSEAMDAMAAVATAEILADRELLRSALQACLIKDRRDEDTFARVFDRFFALRPVVEDDGGQGHSHTHDDLSDEGDLEEYTLSDEVSKTPAQGHSHGPPSNIRQYFDPEDLAEQYNLHQEANRLDMAAEGGDTYLRLQPCHIPPVYFQPPSQRGSGECDDHMWIHRRG